MKTTIKFLALASVCTALSNCTTYVDPDVSTPAPTTATTTTTNTTSNPYSPYSSTTTTQKRTTTY